MGLTLVVTGTDTDVGKTLFAGALAAAIGAHYWKPIQAGLEPTDSETVGDVAGIPADRILPEAYRLTAPCSPHLAAERDGIAIDVEALSLPEIAGPLVIEGAGGLLVPITRRHLVADLFERWGAPVIVVARTALGTINHSLLTIEALRSRDIPILGIVFSGEANEESESIIAAIGGVKRLGRLPHLARLDPASLGAAFAANFALSDFVR
jgi:dethiobiotin synthetase